MKGPRALLIDMGGTLLREAAYDLRPGIDAVVRHPRFRAERSAGELLSSLYDQIDRVHRTNSAEFTLLDWLRGLLPGAADAEIEECERVVWELAARMTPLPGVGEALALAHRSGIRIGVVSNAVFSGGVVRWELARHGLAKFIDLVVSSADVGVRKPDPAIFRAALSRLAVPGREAWFVGDSWEQDVVGSSAALMTPFWLTGPATPPRFEVPHERISGWDEFLGHLAREAATR